MIDLIIRSPYGSKKVRIEFDNHIPNLTTLISQLRSLKFESLQMMPQDYIFSQDYHALAIVVMLLEDLKEIIPNDNN